MPADSVICTNPPSATAVIPMLLLEKPTSAPRVQSSKLTQCPYSNLHMRLIFARSDHELPGGEAILDCLFAGLCITASWFIIKAFRQQDNNSNAVTIALWRLSSCYARQQIFNSTVLNPLASRKSRPGDCNHTILPRLVRQEWGPSHSYYGNLNSKMAKKTPTILRARMFLILENISNTVKELTSGIYG